MKEKIKLLQGQICITLRDITDKSTKSFGLIVPRNIFKRGTEKMFILLKKTYQNPFVELYYEQKNATVIGWRELCERGPSDSMQEMMLRIYTKNYC